jgi:hypothetical protein
MRELPAGRRFSPMISGRIVLLRLAASVACLGAAGAAIAGGGPENVFLVVNANGPSSMEVANHYIELRKIPPSNVCYVRVPPKWNAIPAADFRDKILRPVMAEIDKRGLRDQIDQIVYSCEFPWYVDFTQMFSKKPLPPQNRPRLSLTSATYFHHGVEHEDPSITNLDSNAYYAPSGLAGTKSQGFRGSYQWALGGRRVPTGGQQYLLATSLGFVQPDCSTVAEIFTYLDRAAGADGTKPAGTFYFMQNPDVRSMTRQAGFPAAVAELRGMGFKAEVVRGVVPTGRKDIVGLTTGSAHVRLPAGNCQLMPGALVDNLTSFGGSLVPMTKPNMQSRVTEFLRQGAAGASGTVVEPFAIAQKFPAPTVHVHYARGCTLAEAFYQSVQGPFQLLLVGDPLCRPWADIPQVTVAGLDGDVVSGSVEITPTAKMAAGKKVDHFELFVDGIRVQSRPAGQSLMLDTRSLGDGYHEIRVVAVDDTPIQTQGRWIGGVTVKNGREALQLLAPDGPRVAGDQVNLMIASSREGVTAVYHNERPLGRINGREGRLQLTTEKLGKGRVMLQARGMGKTPVRSQPLWLEIL